MKDNPNTQPGPGEPLPDRGEAIFHGALQLPAGQRAGYLNQACGDDAPLRERVESLLQAHDEAGEFLEKPATPSPAKTVVLTMPLTEKPGDKIGRYKLLQQIGEGGCGVVYMAEQEQPVRRRVALKVIKLGMDTRQVVARFEAERQALALMDHPNIARVLDAGATDTGRPFFVMELVRGIKMTEYCDQNKLSAAERLKLFMQVCHALQHAHQKGIIHRDIKPSNILVTVNDGVPVPKVIDFGIAKATEQRLTEKTVFTAFEQFIGTPAYMSPEQAVLIIGFGVSTFLFVRERAARQRADEAERNEAGLRQQAEKSLKLEAQRREGREMGERIGLGALYLTQDKYPEAEREISPVPISVLTNYVATAFLFNAFGERHARHGGWPEAVTNFSKVVRIVPSDFPSYYALAPLFVQIGDLQAYRIHTGQMLRQFAGTADPTLAARLAKDCLMVAPATNDLEAIGKFVDTAVAAGDTQPDWTETRFVKGLAEYRLGHFADAAEWLQKIASEREPWNRHVEIHAVLAMSQFQLKHAAAARATLMDGIKTAEERLDKVSDGLSRDWPDWIIAHALMREAGALIAEGKRSPSQSE